LNWHQKGEQCVPYLTRSRAPRGNAVTMRLRRDTGRRRVRTGLPRGTWEPEKG